MQDFNLRYNANDIINEIASNLMDKPGNLPVSHRPTAYCLEAFYDRLILRKVFIRLSGAAEDPGFC
jgi:hypothetical protein